MKKIGFNNKNIGLNYLVKRNVGKNLKYSPERSGKEEIKF